MDDLKKQAEELGVTVDENWSDVELQAAIDAALAAPKATKAEKATKAPKAEAKTPIKLLYDTWFEEDVRTAAGKVVSVPVSEAKKLISLGKAERADPLPGDE
jgi:hypothetical protein